MHLIKLCVGIGSVDELEAWRADQQARGLRQPDDPIGHRTRQTPRRAGEIAKKGSLYWVIGGEIRCRQKIIGFEPATREDGTPCCLILMEPSLVRTIPRPCRPFQGWRYLRPEDAPADLDPKVDADTGELVADLARHGLL